jgi:hypothetical protein
MIYVRLDHIQNICGAVVDGCPKSQGPYTGTNRGLHIIRESTKKCGSSVSKPTNTITYIQKRIQSMLNLILLGSQWTQEFRLFFWGLEPTMSQFGGRIDEFEVHVLQMFT